MSVREVFKSFVEPSLERIPILEVSHSERLQGHDYVITHVVQRNVFTALDRKLSRHLAATRGRGFPAFTVDVQLNEKVASEAPPSLTTVHYASVPHALLGIAGRAFANFGKAALTLRSNEPSGGAKKHVAQRNVSPDDFDVLDTALQISSYLGEPEFLTLSGDFDVVIAGPPGDQRPIIMYLRNGNIAMPCSNGTAVTSFECPIHGFAGHVAENMLAQSYMAQAQHALIAAKEAAVAEFRAEAEARIVRFDRALAGRPMEGARLEIASGLIKRLIAGLGPGLNGLSEDAQLAALDWSAAIGLERNAQTAANVADIKGAKAAKA